MLENIWSSSITAQWLTDELHYTQTISPLPSLMWYSDETVGTKAFPAASTNLASLFGPFPLITSLATTSPLRTSTPTIDKTITKLPTTSKITSLTTVFVVPSSPTAPSEVSGPSTTGGASMEAIQSTNHETTSSTILLGLSAGLVIGVLLLLLAGIAGIAGLYLWRRRRNTYNNHVNDNATLYSNSSGSLSTPRQYIKNQDGIERSIESAEKVSIVKNVRAHSVLTRSSAKRPDASGESGINPTATQEQRISVALTSHPMTPSYTALALQKADMTGMKTEAKGEPDSEKRSMQA